MIIILFILLLAAPAHADWLKVGVIGKGTDDNPYRPDIPVCSTKVKIPNCVWGYSARYVDASTVIIWVNEDSKTLNLNPEQAVLTTNEVKQQIPDVKLDVLQRVPVKEGPIKQSLRAIGRYIARYLVGIAYALTASDNFNRSDADPLDGNWTMGADGNLQIISNAVQPSSVTGSAFYNSGSYNTDQWSQITFVSGTDAVDDDNRAAALVRHNGSDYYACVALSDFGGPGSYIGKYISGSLTILASFGGDDWNDGDTNYCEVQGTTILQKINGVDGGTAVDSDLSGGSPGMRVATFGGSAAIVDDWTGGDFLPRYQRGGVLEHKLTKMKKMIFFLLALALGIPNPPNHLKVVEAALVQKLPVCSLGNGYDANKDNVVDSGCPGSDDFTTEASGHYTIQVDSCDLAGTVAAITDANADGGTAIQIPAGSRQQAVFPNGQIRCLVTPAVGTYRVAVRLKIPTAGEVRVWMRDTPMLITQNDFSQYVTNVCTANAGVCVGNQILNYTWVNLTQTLESFGSQLALYFTWDDSTIIDCIDLNTNGAALPTCTSTTVPQTPDYIAFKAGSTPASCSDLAAANVADWTTGFNNTGTTAPTVQLAWKAGTPVKGYLCIQASDADVQAPTTANDDSAIFNGNDDYLEWRLTPTTTTTLVNSILYAANAASTPSKWDGKYITTDDSTNDYTMACTKSGSWSVFCSFDFDFTVADNQLGLVQMLYSDKDTSAAQVYRVLGGINGNPNDPTTFKVIQYSSTALPTPPADTTPPVVGSPSFANVTQNSMQVSFTATDAQSAITATSVDWDTNSGTPYANNTPCVWTAGVANCTLGSPSNPLTPGTSYFVRGSATSGGGSTSGAEANQATSAAGMALYFSPTGSDGTNPCTSQGKPCKNMSHLVSLMTPGATAYLLDGTYTAANVGNTPTGIAGTGVVLNVDCTNGVSGNAVSGTVGAPITVTSLNPRMAHLHNTTGYNSWTAVIQGGCQYWVLDNLEMSSTDNSGGNNPATELCCGGSGVASIYQSSHNAIKRSLIHDNNAYGNDDMVMVWGAGADFNLIEGNELYSFSRNGLTIYALSHLARFNVVRGNYCGQGKAQLGFQNGPNECFVDYTTRDNLWLSNIAEGAGTMCSGYCTSQGQRDYVVHDYGNERLKFYGNISLDTPYGMTGSSLVSFDVKDMLIKLLNTGSAGMVASWGTQQATTTSQNVTILGTTPSNAQAFISLIDATNTTVNPQGGVFKNLLIINGRASGDSSSGGVTMTNNVTFSNIYNPGFSTWSGNWTLGTGVTNTAPTGVGSSSCMVYVPSTSNMYTGGQGGTPLGADLLYAYAADGTKPTSGPSAFRQWSSSGIGTAAYGTWRWAGAVIAGVNNAAHFANGRVASNVHQRLGFGAAATCTLPAGYSDSGNARLGLHVTADELAIWQSRAVSGPYKATSDVSTNSQGDWNRIVANKNTFNSSPSAVRWTGRTVNSCWNLSPPVINKSQGLNLMDAAFYAMVAIDTTTQTNVRTELLAQAGTAGTDFSNTTRWCAISGGEDSTIHDYAGWLVRLLFAYDYTKSSFSGAQQTTMNTWFTNAATYMDTLSTDLIISRFPNRNSGDYSTFGGGWDSSNLGGGDTVIYFGGPTHGNWHEGWNNRAATMQLFVGLVGVMQTNSTFIAHAKRWFQEYLTYNVFFTNGTDCHGGDYYRAVNDGAPNRGWQYAIEGNEAYSLVADALARTGDTSLMDYTTSSGLKGTSGGPKSLACLITTDMKYVVPDLTHYGTSNGANQNLTWRIDTTDSIAGLNAIRDAYAAITNLYFQNAINKTDYLRTRVGAPAYPSSTGAFDEVGEGPRFLLPGILFMFGQMEGVVDPYP